MVRKYVFFGVILVISLETFFFVFFVGGFSCGFDVIFSDSLRFVVTCDDFLVMVDQFGSCFGEEFGKGLMVVDVPDGEASPVENHQRW